MKNKPKILVVEDELIVAEDIKVRLKNMDYEVLGTVASGEQAFEFVGQNKPDLVLMDILLQGKMTGIETADLLWKRDSIPVIFVSAYADKETIEKVKKAEPFGLILKPFEDKELQSVIELTLYKYQTQLQLKEREAWFSSTLKSIGDGVITMDCDGKVTFINPVAETLTGWTLDEVRDKTFDSLFKFVDEKTDESVSIPISKILKTREDWHAPDSVCLVNRHEHRIPISDCTTPIRDEKGAVFGLVLVFRDVSVQKRMEAEKESIQAQLFQIQKMDAVGTLTGGVAHDFNNLLTAIQGCTDMALMKVEKENTIYHDLREVQKAASRAADLTRQLLLFSRKHPTQFVPVDLNKNINDLLKMLHRLIGEDVGISTALHSDLWTVKADPGTLEQVMMNLSVNARDAMPRGGKLSIRTANVTLDASQCMSMPESRTGSFVKLAFSDSGEGMNDEVKAHIFEPFFSTKDPGQGTGLGLSVVYGIIKQHDGWIYVISAPGSGTSFEIYLPAVDEEAIERSEEISSIEDLRGNGERILLVEDAEGVREFALTALSENGYQVLSVLNVTEALSLIETESEPFDMVFSDVVLPDQSGVELAERLIEIAPEIKILLTSGYTDQKSQWDTIQKQSYPFLQKPYTLRSLLKTIHQVLFLSKGESVV
ncbi:response regulator [candidate division KSB1 bacterium]|nr:response regulator [candidate division KSB1 bacterium]